METGVNGQRERVSGLVRCAIMRVVERVVGVRSAVLGWGQFDRSISCQSGKTARNAKRQTRSERPSAGDAGGRTSAN